jgi:hypothetical protein
MNATVHSNSLRGPRQVREDSDSPDDEAVPQTPSPDQPPPHRNPAAPVAPDGEAIETFVGGTGI